MQDTQTSAPDYLAKKTALKCGATWCSAKAPLYLEKLLGQLNANARTHLLPGEKSPLGINTDNMYYL
jgi:hypothetical protein